MYASVATMQQRYGDDELVQVAPDDQSPPAVDTARVESALTDARATIDSYLQARYSLPLASTPDLLVRLNAEIARYLLHDDRASERIQQAYEAAIRLLRDIARGNASLGLPDDEESSARPSGSAQIESAPRVWGRDKSQGYL